MKKYLGWYEVIGLCTIVSLGVLLFFPPPAISDMFSRGRQQALVVGNDAYDTSPLINAVSDARAMADTLEGLGFSVIEKENLNWRQMNEAVTEFGRALQKGGVGLFYYAGHGVQINGTNYLIPIGSDIRHEKEVRYKALDAGQILTEMENSESFMNIIILDACRGNPFHSRFRTAVQGLAYMTAPAGTIIAYSTGPGKKAGDDGMYTRELVEQMNIPGKRLVDMFNSVRRTVRVKTKGTQIPWESTSLESPFYFQPIGNQAAWQPPPEKDKEPVETLPVEAVSMVQESIEETAADILVEPVTGMEFVWVPKGCYEMGCGDWSGDCEDDEMPVHQVCVDGFWMGKYEVTNDQFLLFINQLDGKGPTLEQWFKTNEEDPASPIKGHPGDFQIRDGFGSFPATNVSWYGAKAFAKWMSTKTEGSFDLATEAQWEYAARSGGKPQLYAGGDTIDTLAWISTNSNSLHTVGGKAPNGLGIYDLNGNVWEWCRDIYSETAYTRHSLNNPIEFRANVYTGNGAARVIRGGSFKYDPSRSRCANRGSHWLAGQSNDLGFRIVMNLPSSSLPTDEYTASLEGQGSGN